MESINGMFGMDTQGIIQFLVLGATAILVILFVIWLYRKLFAGPRLPGSRNRVPRLAVTEAAIVDDKRRLVLVRRDNVEHLVMIGGPNDLVIEKEVVRVIPASQPGTQTAQRPVKGGEPGTGSPGAGSGAIAGAASALKKTSESTASVAGSAAESVHDKGSSVLMKGVQAVRASASEATAAGSAAIGKTGSAAGAAAGTIASGVQSAGSKVAQTTSNAASTVSQGATNAAQTTANAAKTAANVTRDTAQSAGSTVAAGVAATGAAASGAASATASSAKEAVAQASSKSAEAIAEPVDASKDAIRLDEVALEDELADVLEDKQEHHEPLAKEAPASALSEAPASPTLSTSDNVEMDINEADLLAEDLAIESDLLDELEITLMDEEAGVEAPASGESAEAEKPAAQQEETLEDEMQRMLNDLAGKR